ncbi:MAG: ATP-binding protein [Clostridiaceae bacterium]
MVNCNIVNIVEEITLSVAEYIKSNHLNLIFDTDIEEKIVACDLDKIERIMLNILSNAIKFSDLGGNIFVNIYDGKKFITITIEDTGIGINEDKLNIIFDRFRQIDKSFTRNEGSGIGLSLVKSLVEMQGGTILVESKYGAGTKF